MATVKKIYVGNTEGKAKKIYPQYVPRTMTARFNLSDSNPATWGEYLDDAANMTAGDSAWDEFFGHYPAMIKDGSIVGELDPSEGYAKYIDGTAADITSGADGDVMIVFPRRDLRIWQDNGYLYVSMTGVLGKANYNHYAHKYKGNDCDWFALGRYKGYYDGSKLRSLSGKTPTASQTIGTFRTYAQAGGTGYEQSAFFQLTYRQAMYMLKYLGQNAQNAVGRGFVDGNSAAHITGGTNALGMDYGETTGKVQCSLFGVEDFWGSINEYIDGIYSNSSRQLSAADGNYNDTGSGYNTISSATASSNWDGYPRYPVGTSEGGFAPLVSNTNKGSGSTYFCDGASVNADRLAFFGGNWSDASAAGVFTLNVSRSASISSATVSSRLMYIHTA